MNITLLLLQTLALFLLTADAARILAIVPVSAPSHHMVIQPILRTLAEAGHDVVVYSIHRLKDPPPTYTDISLISEDKKHLNNNRQGLLKLLHGSPWNCFRDVFGFHDRNMARVLENQNVKKLLRSSEHFDLVITEPFVGQEFTFVFGYKFKAPTIGIQTFITSSLVNLHLGNVFSTASMPELCFGHSNMMSFRQRLVNALFLARNMYIFHYEYLPLVDKKLRAYFPDMPPLQELTKNLSLMFVNDHLTADYAQPRPWNLVPVAGIHIEPEKPLPQVKLINEFKGGFYIDAYLPNHTILVRNLTGKL